MAVLHVGLLLFAALLGFAHGRSFQCTHDAHSSKIVPRVYIEPAHHVMKRAMEQPLRTYVYYDDTINRDIPVSKRERIKNTVIPKLTSFFQQALMVRETQGPILLERDCSPNSFFIGDVRMCAQRCSATTFCGTVQVPEEHLKRCIECHGSSRNCRPGNPSTDGSGVSGVDFVLYVSADPQASACGNLDTIAFASSCQMEAALDRPIAGYINFCPNSNAFATDTSDDFIFAVARHELLHALGFSSSLFPFWRYPNGDPRTERDPNTGLPPQDFQGFYVASDNTVRTVTYPNWQTQSGVISHEVSLLVTEEIVAEGRRHFNCPTLEGVELENQGGSGTAGSHWEERILGNEAMTGVFTFNPVFSRLTFASLKDTGWYAVDDSMAGTLVWGKDAGCGFAAGSCGGYIASQQQSGGSIAPFCTTEQGSNGRALDCTVDRSAVSLCNLVRYTSSLPREYQYFSDPAAGGSLQVTDFCPFQNEFVFTGGAGTQCSDAGNQPSNNINAETYGAGSRCVKQGREWHRGNVFNTVYGSGCYQHKCSTENGVTLEVFGHGYTCSCEGEELVIDITANRIRYTGSLICPSCAQICYDQLDQCPTQEPASCFGRQTVTAPAEVTVSTHIVADTFDGGAGTTTAVLPSLTLGLIALVAAYLGL